MKFSLAVCAALATSAAAFSPAQSQQVRRDCVLAGMLNVAAFLSQQPY
jgi:hypothetical protein